MLGDLFGAIKDALVDHIRLATGYQPTMSAQAPVVFTDAAAVETVDFPLGAVTMLLLNLEEDRKALPADPYRRAPLGGTAVMVSPPIALNVTILFVVRFSNYLDGLRHLDLIVRFFQKHRAMDPSTIPNLAGTHIDKVVCELFTVPLSELNHVWGPLNTAYHPSVMYRLRVVFFHDADGIPAVAAAKSTEMALSKKPDKIELSTKSGSTIPPPTVVGGMPESAHWAYYCITDLADAVNKMQIVDTESVSPLYFSANCRSLGAAPDTSDVLGTYLVSRHPGAAVLRFVSNTAVNVDEEPRRNIELRLDGEVLSRPLANPSKSSLSRIDLSLPGEAANACDVLTHVIEYRSQLSQTTT